MSPKIGQNRVVDKPNHFGSLHPHHAKLHLKCDHPKVNIRVFMGDGPATPSAGYAGWEEVPRIQRRALTAFKGLPAFQQDVPILIDGFADEQSVEATLKEVLRLGGKAIFMAEGPIFDSGHRFVFGDEPEFGEMVREAKGTLIRCRLTLKLMRYVPVDAKPKKADAEADRGFAPTYKVTAGVNTLSKIAHLLYPGEAGRWKKIGEKNGISDPYAKLKLGREVRL